MNWKELTNEIMSDVVKLPEQGAAARKQGIHRRHLHGTAQRRCAP